MWWRSTRPCADCTPPGCSTSAEGTVPPPWLTPSDVHGDSPVDLSTADAVDDHADSPGATQPVPPSCMAEDGQFTDNLAAAGR